MQSFTLFIENRVTISELKFAMQQIFPLLNFYDWDIQENIIGGEKDKELRSTDILMDIINLPGLFKTLIQFYRFPGEEANSYADLYVAIQLCNIFNCRTTINGYNYCDFDQMPDYSLLLENGKAYLIGDCYAQKIWPENDERIKTLQINKIQEIDLSNYELNFGHDGLKY